MDWADRVDQLLYDGETEQRQVTVGDATIVVTSHRVLAFTPDSGYRYRSVDRPNVDTVSVESTGTLQYLVWTVVLACLAIGGAVTALLFSFTNLVATPALEDGSDSGPAGTDVATESIDTIESLLAVLDVAVVAASALSIGLAAVCFVLYARSRSRQFVIHVRGEDDIGIAVGSDTVGTTAIELQNAIRPGPPLETDTTLESLRDDERSRVDSEANVHPDASTDPATEIGPRSSTDREEQPSTGRTADDPFDVEGGDDPDTGTEFDAVADPDPFADEPADEHFDPGPTPNTDGEKPDDGGFDLDTADAFEPGSTADLEEFDDCSGGGDEDDTIDDLLAPADDGGFDVETRQRESVDRSESDRDGTGSFEFGQPSHESDATWASPDVTDGGGPSSDDGDRTTDDGGEWDPDSEEPDDPSERDDSDLGE